MNLFGGLPRLPRIPNPFDYVKDKLTNPLPGLPKPEVELDVDVDPKLEIGSLVDIDIDAGVMNIIIVLAVVALALPVLIAAAVIGYVIYRSRRDELP